ncbi:MAG TPA: type VI secretion system ATPase TssH [Phycisphaerae bacterium]|jgi:type VI secretion system protein VasG
MSTIRADDLRSLIGRFDPACLQCFQGAASVCQSRTHFEITPEHLLLRLIDDATGDVAQIFNTFRVERTQIRRALQRILDELPSGHRGKPALSPKLMELFQSANVWCEELGLQQIRTGLLLLAFVLNPSHTRVGEFTPELDRIDVDQLRDRFHEIVSTSTEAAAPGAAGGATPAEGGALAQFTIDLTVKAAAGEIDPVFGRDHEIRQMIDILARRRKNNPILVGEPGTGKTAIVEGLALRITQGDVPPMLKGVKLITLDLGLLQAGASVKGQFEERLKNVIKEIKSSETPIITFIDEAHTLIGAGGSAGGSDAANLLKPALARGELRTIAATTWAEYKKYFEKDAALERRFQVVRCEEPSVENAVVMLRGLKEKYEQHHKTIILDEAVSAAAQLSSRYISGRFLPDKAVDLLDTSAARVAVGLSTRPGALEDIDRQLSHLETAITAIQRDHATGISTNDGMLAEMEGARAGLLTRRGEVEQVWQSELAAIRRIHELRAKLIEMRRASAGGNGQNRPDASENRQDAKDAKRGARKEGGPRSGPNHLGDLGVLAVENGGVAVGAGEAELRREMSEAMQALEQVRGEEALVHPHVDAAAVAAVVADWTGIPVGSMVKDEIAAILEMEDRLRGRVVGQDHALAIVAEKLRTARSGLGNPAQPMGVFLCVGPSGVGKTELALTLADLLFGGERFTITINMSEFMEKHTVSQLKGSPPGYVGYGEGGVLTEAVRQRPYSVVLLDEVEKAHPDVLNLFYQVFDKGTLADGEGRVIDFKNTVFILTSNLGTDVIQGMCESGGAVQPEELKEAIYPHLREHFKPALLARMAIVPFLTIGREVMKSIARLKVRKIVKRLADVHKLALEVDDAVYDAIAARCTQVDVGARNIDHILDREVLPALSRRLLERMRDEELPKVVRMSTDGVGNFGYEFA